MPPTRDLQEPIPDDDKQMCMTCGGEWTEDLPCTCNPAAHAEGDRYMLHSVHARLCAVLEEAEAHASVWEAVDTYYHVVLELITNLQAYLSQG